MSARLLTARLPTYRKRCCQGHVLAGCLWRIDWFSKQDRITNRGAPLWRSWQDHSVTVLLRACTWWLERRIPYGTPRDLADVPTREGQGRCERQRAKGTRLLGERQGVRDNRLLCRCNFNSSTYQGAEIPTPTRKLLVGAQSQSLPSTFGSESLRRMLTLWRVASAQHARPPKTILVYWLQYMKRV
jgi:hypothetical protein